MTERRPLTLNQRRRIDRLRREEPKVVRKDLKCPDCGAPMRLKLGTFRRFYGCVRWKKTGCKGSHSAHDDGRPAGNPGSTIVRRARKAVMDFTETGPLPEGVDQPAHVAQWGLKRCNNFLEAVGLDPVLAPTALDRLLVDEDHFEPGGTLNC